MKLSLCIDNAIDISIPVFPGMGVYPGECETQREWHLTPDESNPCTCTHWSMTAHAGTHLDAPRHFDRNGRSLDQFSPKEFVFRAAVLDASGLRADRRHIDSDFLDKNREVLSDCDAVLFRTHDGALWKEKEFDPQHTAVAPDAAQKMANSGKVRLVGIDYFSVEPFGSDPAETHLALLTKGLLIMEGIDLSSVEPGRYDLLCIPVLWRDAEAAPCRALLIPPLTNKDNATE